MSGCHDEFHGERWQPATGGGGRRNVREQILASGRTVVVLCGGDSTEREVSLVSGKAVADAIAANGLPCELIELTQNRLPSGMDPARQLVIPAIHGKYGEDGCLSAELDLHGFAYAGCRQAASVLCYDKLASKSIAARLGIPLAQDRLLDPDHGVGFETLAAELGLPFILKPRYDGSSVGLYLVDSHDAYAAAAASLRKTQYMAEAYADGIDLTVGILGDEALGVVAVRPKGGLYDYDHKYKAGMSRYEVPAASDPGLAGRLRQWSKAVFDVSRCRDMARVDYRMSSDGQVYFLEINTIPGMTPTSLLPKSASCCGISFEQIVLMLAGFAVRRSVSPQS